MSEIKYHIKEQPDFNNPLVWKNLKHQCYDGTINYTGFPADEYKYFDRLRVLYLSVSAGIVNLNDAKQEEQEIYREYTRSKEREKRSLAVYKKYQYERLKLNALKIKINKASSAEYKLKYALELIGLLTDDELFIRVNGRLLKND